jgi:hypothetical protein
MLRFWGMQYIEELILNNIVFLRVWGMVYIEELILILLYWFFGSGRGI